MADLAALRQNYMRGGLTEDEAGTDPFALFRLWFEQALQAGLLEPNAMTLATVSPEGQPAARAVLLKALDDRGFTFFTNYESRKGNELASNPKCALLFLWHPLERQIRIEGIAEQVTTKESDDYYHVRPVGSRLGAWASPQSAVIPSREWLEIKQQELTERFQDGVIPRPANWGGYRVIPQTIEFWQGRPNRLHDRIRFSRKGLTWLKERLAP